MSSPLLARLGRRLESDSRPRSSLPQAAVLVLIDTEPAMAEVVLTRRADHLRLHAGEIAFPGGRRDATDRDPWHTARREAEEEIGLPQDKSRNIGTLPPLVTRSRIEVRPCVAELLEPVEFTVNADELVEVFNAPLAWFAEPGHLHFDTLAYGERRHRVPRYQWQNHTIWGITAAILVQLAKLGCDADLELEHYWQAHLDAHRLASP